MKEFFNVAFLFILLLLSACLNSNSSSHGLVPCMDEIVSDQCIGGFYGEKSIFSRATLVSKSTISDNHQYDLHFEDIDLDCKLFVDGKSKIMAVIFLGKISERSDTHDKSNKAVEQIVSKWQKTYEGTFSDGAYRYTGDSYKISYRPDRGRYIKFELLPDFENQ